jgi:peptidoglycan/xylan/chitin deacetylase (PgdA/CDA1 family)
MSVVRAFASVAFLFVVAAPAAGADAQTGPFPPVADTAVCAGRTDTLGISRVVEIDTATGPSFGDQYKEVQFLEDHEVVLTFDDGPMRRYTMPILDALDAQCTKATFFSVGRMAIADPATLREVAKRGHTIGSHTWSHKKATAISPAAATFEMELGLSAVTKALGAPVAPFFRFPYLAYTKAAHAHLASRGIGTFGIHVDSRDFRTRSPGTVLRNVMSQLEHEKKGIILFHDIQPSTAGALASLLAELKSKGFKVVHMVAKNPATTLPEYDAIAEKALRAKLAAAATNPLATRAVTWPTSAGAWGEAGPAGEIAGPSSDATPAATPISATRSTRRTLRKTDWSNMSEDPWQLKSFGIAGGQ